MRKKKHQKTLELIFSRPVSGNIPWRDIEALMLELGADKGAIASIREWFRANGVNP